ncbi:hypothetical protein WN944_003932 [Citrus x changshan-huyou]|uniref:Uncharacterized protein n=1 Tax=Citrus x changshan-huyou TaxID=2935761 RepID=A0AAP0M2X1_9ROSI
MGIVSLITGRPGSSGFGSASTAEQVTDGIDATNLTAVITEYGTFIQLIRNAGSTTLLEAFGETTH